MYYRRHIEERLKKISTAFKVILVLGARQVGKTTILKKTFADLDLVTFDPHTDIMEAQRDPDLFLEKVRSPIILDEVQFAPHLFSSIKRKVDTRDEAGQYFLTGYQNIMLLKKVAESMAGRVAIIDLEHISLLEQADKHALTHNWIAAYLENPETFFHRPFARLEQFNLMETIWRGSFPRSTMLDTSLIPEFFNDYQRTCLERDIYTIIPQSHRENYSLFLQMGAALTGQEVNVSHFGREFGLYPQLTKEWLHALTLAYQWRTLQPYKKQMVARLVKKPKGYITDTGLACALLKIGSPLSLAGHPLVGALFETWVVNHIHQLITPLATRPALYHWRLNSGAEVDIVLERDGMLYPIEVKLSSHITKHDLRGIQSFRRAHKSQKIAPALVIYGGTRVYQVDENTLALPWNVFCL